MKITVKQLSKQYQKIWALRDISFEFETGQIYGFIGPNGAGKTTTLRILATLDMPTSGEAYIGRVAISQYPERIRGLVGFVPDTLPGQSDITVHEYIEFFARAYGLKGKQRVSRIEAVENFTNLIGLRDKLVNALSKGMKQRVSLARALVHDPPVLLLDEPASGLDPRARIELRELLRILSQQQKAILISSHILTELTEICDGAIIIEKGELKGNGQISQLLLLDRPHQRITIRALGDQERLLQTLLETPKIHEVRPEGAGLTVALEGDETDSAELLTSLVNQGYRIVAYQPQKTDLEDLFMRLTQGDVQ